MAKISDPASLKPRAKPASSRGWRLARRLVKTVLLTMVVLIIGVLVYGAYRTRTIAMEAERDYPPLGQFVEAGGEHVHYVDIGDKTAPPNRTIILLHGASTNLRDILTSIGTPLSEHNRVIAFDRPGHGWTSRQGGRKDAQLLRQADILLAALKAIGVERAVMVGHSYSGALVLAMALDRPEHVAAAVLISPVANPWLGGVGQINDIAVFPVIGTILSHTIVAPVGLRSLSEALKFVFAPSVPPPDYIEISGLPLVLRPADFTANAEDLVDLLPQIKAQAPRYAGLSLPMLIISSDIDQIVSPAIHAQALAKTVSGAKLVTLAGAGHVPLRTRTAEVSHAIEDFLKSVP